MRETRIGWICNALTAVLAVAVAVLTAAGWAGNKVVVFSAFVATLLALLGLIAVTHVDNLKRRRQTAFEDRERWIALHVACRGGKFHVFGHAASGEPVTVARFATRELAGHYLRSLGEEGLNALVEARASKHWRSRLDRSKKRMELSPLERQKWAAMRNAIPPPDVP